MTYERETLPFLIFFKVIIVRVPMRLSYISWRIYLLRDAIVGNKAQYAPFSFMIVYS